MENLGNEKIEIKEYPVISREFVKENYVHKDKIREKLLKPIQEEGKKVYKSFMSKKKEENFEIDGAILQELGWIEGIIQELLEEE